MLIVVTALLAVAGDGAEPVAAADAYLCYRAVQAHAERGATPFPAFTPRVGASVVDALASAGIGEQHLRDVRKAVGLCVPATTNGLAPGEIHLEAYAVTRTRTTPRQQLPIVELHEVVNDLGILRLAIRGSDRVLVPAEAARGTAGVPTPTPDGVDDFACYAAKAVTPAGGFFAPRAVTVDDWLGTHTLRLSKPTRVCAPAEVDGADPGALAHATHLMCYRARVARTGTFQAAFERMLASTSDRFGSEVLAVTAIDELCVASIKDPPHPTVTPLVVPSARTATPRMPTFTPARTPTATHTPTPSRTPTPKTTHTATPSGSPTLSATPTRSATPPPTRSATPTVTRSPTPTLSPTPVGTPRRFVVSPAARTIQDGATTNFTAIAQFVNGATQNYTQKLTWNSSNDAIATVSNDAGMHGRTTGKRPGTVTISVRDPVSGRVSAKADSATLTVLGALAGITLSPTTSDVHVGDHVLFTATGHYVGGATQNLTQKVTYASTNSAVAVATNSEGNRSLVNVVGEGEAMISAVDPDTGITSSESGGDATITVTR